MMGRRLRVLLLEDNSSVAALIADALARSELAPVLERVQSVEGFDQAVREFAPHVVLSGPALAECDAVTALHHLRTLRPTVPFIVVSQRIEAQTVVDCFRAGAEDLVLHENLDRLVPAITEALRIRAPLEKLSPRQLEVLRLVADGLTTREIAAHLELSVKTVETHRGEVMKRLGIHDLVGLVRYAVRLALVGCDGGIVRRAR